MTLDQLVGHRAIRVLLVAAALIVVGSAKPAYAALILDDIASPIIAMAGETLAVSGTITNTTGVELSELDLFLNFSGYDPSAISPLQVLGLTPFNLPNNTFLSNVHLFDLELAITVLPGLYSFAVQLQDINNNLSDLLLINVEVPDSGTPMPEPTAFVLAWLGIAALSSYRYFRRTHAQTN